MRACRAATGAHEGTKGRGPGAHEGTKELQEGHILLFSLPASQSYTKGLTADSHQT
jgi:hypothetical protein